MWAPIGLAAAERGGTRRLAPASSRPEASAAGLSPLDGDGRGSDAGFVAAALAAGIGSEPGLAALGAGLGLGSGGRGAGRAGPGAGAWRLSGLVARTSTDRAAGPSGGCAGGAARPPTPKARPHPVQCASAPCGGMCSVLTRCRVAQYGQTTSTGSSSARRRGRARWAGDEGYGQPEPARGRSAAAAWGECTHQRGWRLSSRRGRDARNPPPLWAETRWWDHRAISRSAARHPGRRCALARAVPRLGRGPDAGTASGPSRPDRRRPSAQVR